MSLVHCGVGACVALDVLEAGVDALDAADAVDGAEDAAGLEDVVDELEVVAAPFEPDPEVELAHPASTTLAARAAQTVSRERRYIIGLCPPQCGSSEYPLRFV